MTDVRRVMRPNRRRFLFGSAGGAVSYALGLSPTLSQPLPSTARILVGFPPGGPTDVIARLLAEQMKAYASSTIVENRPGAGGRVVMDALKNSAADGSVMVLTPAVAMCSLSARLQVAQLQSAAGFHSGYDHLHHLHAVCGRPDGPQHGEDTC